MHKQNAFLWILFTFVLNWVYGSEFDRCPAQSRRGGDLRVHGNRCYQFYAVEMYWHEGRQWCLDRGGDLITIHRQDIQEFVVRSLKEVGWRRNGVWIGATDMHEEDNWNWVTGQNVRSGYQNWDRGQPSCWMPLIKDLCKEDCAVLRTDEGYKWHDYFCAAKHFEYGFICQYDMLPEPTRGPNVAANTLKISGNQDTTVKETTKPTTKVTSPKIDVATLKDVKVEGVGGEYSKSGSPCHYGNKTYQSGDTFPDLDDCNTCYCHDGGVGCTEMACIKNTVNCFFNKVWYNNGDKIEVLDKCQWCYCKNGEVKCSTTDKDCKKKDDNEIGVHSQQVAASQDDGMKTGSVVGMVVAFILVFVAGLIIGIFLCKRRYKKRYEETASAGFSNVLYTAAPQQTEVKQMTLMMAEQDSDYDEDPPHYTSIDNICIPPPYTEAAATGTSIYDEVADVKKVHLDNASEEAVGQVGGESDLTVDLPPTPCGMSTTSEINLCLPQQPADGISEAYSNNLYGVQ